MVSNPNFYGQSTTGTPNQIEDGVDFPHTGIIKSLSLGLGQNYVISGFDITAGTNQYTQIDVSAGVICREGKVISSGGQLASGVSDLTMGYTTANGYHLLVVDSSNNIVFRSPSAVDKVPSYNTGDIIIAVVTYKGSSTNPDIQYLTFKKTENSLSVARSASGTYTEMGTITADTDSIDIVSTATNADINITPNGTGKIVLDDLNWPISDGSTGQFLKTDGFNQLSFDTIDTSSLIAHTDIPDSDTGFVKRTGVETYDIDTNTYLTAESDTLDTVTGRGATTANDITVGDATVNTITSSVNQNISYEVVDASNPTISGNKTVVYVHDISSLGNNLILPTPASGNILYIKNFFTNTITITGNPLINQTDTTHPKITAANIITLEPFEHVTLQAVNDSIFPLQVGHIIISDGDKDRSANYATAAQGTTADANATAITAINTKASVRATMSATHSYTISGAEILPFDQVDYDEGSDFDTTNYKFTAPRDGKYFISLNCYFTSAPDWAFTSIYEGGLLGTILLRGPSSNDLKELTSTILELSSGDEIYAAITAQANGTVGNLSSITYFVIQEMV